MVRARRDGVERQRKLVVPAELKARARERQVPVGRARVLLGEVGGVRGDAVRDDALLDVVAVGQAEVLLRGDVAQHRRACLCFFVFVCLLFVLLVLFLEWCGNKHTLSTLLKKK